MGGEGARGLQSACVKSLRVMVKPMEIMMQNSPIEYDELDMLPKVAGCVNATAVPTMIHSQ